MKMPEVSTPMPVITPVNEPAVRKPTATRPHVDPAAEAKMAKKRLKRSKHRAKLNRSHTNG